MNYLFYFDKNKLHGENIEKAMAEGLIDMS